MTWRELLVVLTYLVGAGELILAGYFWRTNSGNEIRKVMSLLALVTGLWVIVTAMNTYTTSPIAEFRDKFTYVFGVLLVTTLFHFSLVFPYPMLRLDRLHYVFFYLPVIIFSIVIFQGGYIVSHYYSGPTLSGEWVGGPLYWPYNLYLLGLYVASIVILLRKFKRTDGIHHRNLVLVFWSILLGGAPGVIVDLVQPLFHNVVKYPLIGTLSTIFWLGLTSYIILRK